MTQIHWRQWRKETFEEAQSKKLPVLLAISATWCHWCHVMDKTTYGNVEVAKLINEKFIPIRVDTDKRPEINQRYNVGGWPTVAILTSKGNMIDAQTYLPASNMIAFLSSGFYSFESLGKQFDERFEEFFKKKKPNIVRGTSFNGAGKEILHQANSLFDDEFGGFGFEPKFPNTELLNFLLNQYFLFKEKQVMEMLEKTLPVMSISGMFDSEEQGFFRYATNRDWSIPHFEKMLEDNANLVHVYLEAFKLSKKEEYKQTALNTLDYLFSNLFDKENGVFFGSQDADEEYYKLSLSERKQVKAPFIDKTIFTDWNSLMISSLLNAYAVTKDEKFKKTAFDCFQFLFRKNFDGKQVFHFYDSKQDKSFQSNLLKDYALLLRAAINCFEFSNELAFLEKAEKLLELINEKFFDSERNAFFDIHSSDDSFGILKDKKFSSQENALMIQCLVKFSFLKEDDSFMKIAEKVGESVLNSVNELSIYTAGFVDAVSLLDNGLTEIKIFAKDFKAIESEFEDSLIFWSHNSSIKFVQSEKEFEFIVCIKKNCLPVMKSVQEIGNVMYIEHNE